MDKGGIKTMFACVVNYNGREVYSSFHNNDDEAIEYAKRMSGVLRVERAHSDEPPIWERATVEKDEKEK